MTSLLRTRRFLPLFVTQFLGAMNDNLFKNALVILILYRLAEEGGQLLITAAAGLFILPYLLFSALAGTLADRFEKSAMIRRIKGAEIAIMGLGTGALYLGDPRLLIGVLFLMGSQSAFFSPLKFSILPQHLRDDELVAGNGLIEAGTFLAILVGTIAGGLIVLQDQGVAWISAGILGLAVLGWLSSLAIPRAPTAAAGTPLTANLVAATWSTVRHATGSRTRLLSILGIAWFWLIGATFLAQFPNLARDVLGANEQVVTLFLVCFAVGVGAGSMLCGRLLNGEVSARHVPLAAIALTVFIGDLCLALAGRVPAGPPIGAADFLSEPANWRILADLVAIAVAGGMFNVPLMALLQHTSSTEHRARNIAASNFFDALFMVAGTAWAAAMLAFGFGVPDLLATIAAVNALVAIYICIQLPEPVLKPLLKAILRLLFRVRVAGLENYRLAGERAVIVANHVSFLDGLLLAVFLPGRPVFAINTQIADAWWVRPFLPLVRTFKVDPTSPLAVKALVGEVRKGRHLVIFPEGRLTVTGGLMKVYEGPGMIADRADAELIPVRIHGAESTVATRLDGKIRRRLFPRISLTVLPPRRIDVPADLTGRHRRQRAGERLYDVMSDLMYDSANRRRTLFDALLDARRIHGGTTPVLEDIDRQPASYDRLVLGALILGRKLATLSEPAEAVGVMLPNSIGAAVCFFALQARGRVPAMLNFSAGPRNLVSACRTARIRTVLTSRRFVQAGKLEDLVAALESEATVVFLEDLRAGITILDKLAGLAARPLARWVHRRHRVDPDAPAAILFTSGSEGTPKGVVLSHANLLANRYQLAARIDFNASDVAFNALPIFHSFGLTGGLILPLLSGVRVFLYPSPLHYRVVPALAYDTSATILFGTDTFLAGYARVAHAYDFYSVRHVFAGAERVRDETRRVWADRFGLRILEGYGATETAPVIAVNTPMHFRAGTVGRLVPGISARLEPVPGVQGGGRLFVRGPNVMLGYLLSDRPGDLQPPVDGEYDTGDIVDIDADGFVRILGRAKRFAKIAGEMVSLGAVESLAEEAWPGAAHAVVALPDPRKGEQLVLVTERPDATRERLSEAARAAGATELMVPRLIRIVDRLPLLGTGKVDYPAVAALAAGQAA